MGEFADDQRIAPFPQLYGSVSTGVSFVCGPVRGLATLRTASLDSLGTDAHSRFREYRHNRTRGLVDTEEITSVRARAWASPGRGNPGNRGGILLLRFTLDEDRVVAATENRAADPNPLGSVRPDRGQFVFTDWSQRQCSTLLGVRWDRWFENCSSSELAVDVNRRFARARGSIRLRTVRARDAEPGVDVILRAFVSPGYTAIADSRVASLMETALTPMETDLPIIRVDQTDRSTTFVVGVGKPYRIGGPGNVGDVWGGLLIRNSGVGFASLLISMHLTRLLCKNGMVAPLHDAIVVRKRHRFFDDGKLRGVLAE